MSFIESYKRLEKISGEILNDDRRVSAYIDEMINTPHGAYFVKDWDIDLKQLKHYRWVRNKIVHEPSCTEENMCEPSDAVWLDNFYSRIMNQTDPLALYDKATKSHTTMSLTQDFNSENSVHTYSQSTVHRKKSSSKKKPCIIFLIVIILIAVILLAVKLNLNYEFFNLLL